MLYGGAAVNSRLLFCHNHLLNRYMGAVHFSLDQQLMQLFAQNGFDYFVETGTFEGETIDAAKSIFKRIYSVELSPTYAAQAKEKYNLYPHITIIESDSAAALRRWKPELNDQCVLYFLDAHWCVATATAGETSQCPLLEEIDAIGILNLQSAIVIDDARLFLCTPGAPHEVSQWPQLHDIFEHLQKLSSSHRITVINDNIIFYPAKLETKINQYAYEYSVDWLQIIHKTRDYEELRQQFVGLNQQAIEKENLINQQAEALKTMQSDLAVNKELVRKQFRFNENWINSFNLLFVQISEQWDVLKKKSATSELESFIANHSDLIKDYIFKFKQQLVQTKDQISNLPIQTFGLSLDYLSHRLIIRLLNKFCRVPGVLKLLIGPSKFTAKTLAKIECQLKPRLGCLVHHAPTALRLPPPYAVQTTNPALPVISIVTPSFRQADFIERTLHSVLDQNYPKLEYVVQDGGSTDGTVEILQNYASRLASWESKPDGGQSQAINLGFAKTSGDIMAWLNSDDLLLPGSLNYVADYFAQHPEIDVVYGHRILINEHDQEIGRWVLPPHQDEVLKWADYVPQETLFWRRSLWEKIGGIDESFRFAMDWDLIMRFRTAGAKFVRLPRFLGAFRIHAAQKTSAQISEIGLQEMDRIREQVHGYVPKWLEIRKAITPYLLQHLAYDWASRLKQRFNRH